MVVLGYNVGKYEIVGFLEMASLSLCLYFFRTVDFGLWEAS